VERRPPRPPGWVAHRPRAATHEPLLRTDCRFVGRIRPYLPSPVALEGVARIRLLDGMRFGDPTLARRHRRQPFVMAAQCAQTTSVGGAAAASAAGVSGWPGAVASADRAEAPLTRENRTRQRRHALGQIRVSSANLARSMFPPETTATIGPSPALPEVAAATASAPAPSAMTRSFSATSLMA
jgi:hypothetical protein